MSSLRISLKNITKRYNNKEILKDCSYDFETGKIHAIIGPNGSGKSTLLRISTLLEAPDTGRVVYTDGYSPLFDDLTLRRRISLLLPKGGLFNTTVFKNVSYGLKIRGFNKNSIFERVESVLKDVGLWEKRNQNARTLSTGEGQRLALARIIVLSPEVLFLDEPTKSLDPGSTAIIEDMIKKIKTMQTLTIIMVTHNMFQAQRLADRVLFMYEGRIVDEGTGADFFEIPTSRNEKAWRFITGKMIY